MKKFPVSVGVLTLACDGELIENRDIKLSSLSEDYEKEGGIFVYNDNYWLAVHDGCAMSGIVGKKNLIIKNQQNISPFFKEKIHWTLYRGIFTLCNIVHGELNAVHIFAEKEEEPFLL